jgi:BlaI family penicillinase repressor
MPRRHTPGLTDAELRVIRVLWTRPRATVNEVIEQMGPGPTPAYNTVLTMLGILQRKGWVTREKEGRAHAYLAVVDRKEARRTALTQLLSRFFDNSPRELVLDLLGHERTDAEELRHVRALIGQAPTGEDATPGDRKRQRG